ncbi:MAG: hypothetical protein NXI08_12610 [bacterium]|nr:hypothetical protein [bacterium]
MNRREFAKKVGLASGVLGFGVGQKVKASSTKKSIHPEITITPELSARMYDKALSITKSKVRGGESEPFFKEPFIDAAFSENIFLWDTAFMCCFAKYHMDELPVYQALDNFYGRMEEDGFICREYRANGEPLWPKDHPVSINPPLLAWAEIEIFGVNNNKERIKEVYPILKKNFEFHVERYQGEEGLFWGDTLGMGMDNIPRSPRNWVPERGNGMTHHELGAKLDGMIGASPQEKLEVFITEYVDTKQGVWNSQGRLVDFTAQMAMFSLQLKEMAAIAGKLEDIPQYDAFHNRVKLAINDLCWNEEDAFYYDLGYGEQIVRRHIGMYWTLMGDLVPENRLQAFLAHLTDPDEFYRLTPLPALSAADPDYIGFGDYWLGGVWAPTVYMTLRGLTNVGEEDLARMLAAKIYENVAIVFEATDTFWENYAPDLISYGMPSKKDFCGWTALIPISIYREYIM